MTTLLGEDGTLASFEITLSLLQWCMEAGRIHISEQLAYKQAGLKMTPKNMGCAGDDALVIRSSCQ